MGKPTNPPPPRNPPLKEEKAVAMDGYVPPKVAPVPPSSKKK